jgi:23S rRNA (uridine2552-2'-O)-methyltransferase
MTGLMMRPTGGDFFGNDPVELDLNRLELVFQSFEQRDRIHFISVSDPELSTSGAMKRSADYYSKLAKQKNFPARSVFKLQEMQERFSLLKAGQKILDLGSAPGSWSKYCLQRLGAKGQLVGVDLEPVEIAQPPGRRYRFLQGDFFSEAILDDLEKLGPFDVILSDAAPRTSGSGLVDAQRSLEIAERVLEIVRRTLRPGGHLVLKIFQGGEEGQLLRRMKSMFRHARAFKPKASRGESRETYFLGQLFGCES